MKIKYKLLNWIFSRFQQACPHDPSWVRADILEGENPNHLIQWCLRCGAYRHVTPYPWSEWREPRADWCDAPTRAEGRAT